MSDLPEYDRPPVDETVLSIQFAPLGLSVPHYGMYWSRRRNLYPKCEVHPPVASIIEQFGAPLRQPQMGVRLVSTPESRFWMLEETENRLFQIQKDRFIHNWRRIRGDEAYPRYPTLRKALLEEWREFRAFLKTEQLGDPKVNQCEVTYVNHIEHGDEATVDLSRLFKGWPAGGVHQFLPQTESVNLQLHYRFPAEPGRLHLSLEPVIRGRDGKEVLQLTLLARGQPKSSSDEDVFAWLDKGREWVVRGFADFMTDEIQQLWGRI